MILETLNDQENEIEKLDCITNFIQLYLHQFFDDSHCLNGTQKPLKIPFNRYQSCIEAINNG